MTCFLTGGSGFIGGNLLHELVARGHRVRALLRPGANLRGIEGIEYERVTGDITDRSDDLAALMQGCDWCFHLAASYALWLPDYGPMYKANVLGTQKVIRAAMKARCSRIVYTSTTGCIGLPKRDALGNFIPTDEQSRVSESQMSSHYKRSKWQAEVAARQLAEEGAPLVIVNPSAPVGPGDVRPTPTGRVIVDFLNQAMPAYLDTGLNWVSVRDVAVGHILAAEKGRVGERYILGNESGNWSLKQGFQVLSEISGVPAPRFQLPFALALGAAHVDEWISRLTHRPPRAPLAGVRMAQHRMWFNPRKAVQELGLPQTPPQQALREAVDWFRRYGYVKKKGRDA